MSFIGMEYSQKTGDLPVDNACNALISRWIDLYDYYTIDSVIILAPIVGDFIIYKGEDVEPPAKVVMTREEIFGDSLILEWIPSEDNVITAYYEVLGKDTVTSQVNHISYVHDIKTTIPFSEIAGKIVRVRAWDIDSNGSEITWDSSQIGIDDKTGKDPEIVDIECVPNPFNPSTVIRVNGITNEETDVNVSAKGGGKRMIEIFDISGKLVKSFHPSSVNRLPFSIIWDAQN
jgi:hypothetical protein